MSIHISDKTLQDLEFSTVLEQISTFSISDLGKKQTLEITPFLNKKMVVDELAYTNEYLSSFESDNRIPNHGFDNINDQIKRLKIENSYLEPESFLKIKSISETIIELKKRVKSNFNYFYNGI